jgi:long-chain fatty acid transport protein
MKVVAFQVALLVRIFLANAPVHAQNTNDINGGIQFEFGQPAGARSQGIGGAFVAVADDATTAHDNPAGLTTFKRPEVSVELRGWDWTTTFPNSGHAFGPASGIGIDTVNGLVNGTTSASAAALSFASFVYPFQKWSFGAYRRQTLKYEMQREPQGAFFTCQGGARGEGGFPPFCEPHAATTGVDRLFPAKQSMRVDVSSIGGAAAYQVSRSLSVGAGVELALFDIDGSNEVFAARNEQVFEAPDFSDPENVELRTREIGDDTSWNMNAGLMWQPTDKFSVGVAFHNGPRFTFHTTTVNRDGVSIIDQQNVFKVPDSFASGVAFRPNPNAGNNYWLVSAQFEHIWFSQIMEDFRESGTWRSNPEEIVTVEHLVLDDVNRVRGGLEFVTLVSGAALAFRTGLTHDPQHQLHFQPDDESTGFPDPRAALYFPRGHDDVQVAVGFGVALRRFQVDFAADFSNARNTYVLSAVFGLR